MNGLKSVGGKNLWVILTLAPILLLSFVTISHNAFADTVITTINSLGTPYSNSPLFIGVNQDTDKIYVTSKNDVFVIDGSTDSLANTIQLPSNQVAVNPSTDMIYATADGSTVSEINGTTDTIAGTITGVGTLDQGVAVNPNTNTIYVGASGAIYIINGTTNTVINKISDLDCNSCPVAVNPNTNRLYAIDFGNSENGTPGVLVIIDGANNTIVGKTTLPGSLGYVAVNPETNRIYVTSWDVNDLFVVDGATNSLIDTITIGSNPNGVAVNPSTNKIYVANGDSQTVSVIDGLTNKVLTSLPVGSGPIGVGVNPATNKIYVANSGSNSVTVINGSSSSTGGSGSSGDIVLGNAQSTTGATSSSNQITLSNFNAGSGADQLLVVGISANNNNAVSITFNGTPLTQAVSSFANNDAEFWYLKNPTGTGNIVATFAGQAQAVVGAYSISGVNQTSPIATHIAMHSTSASSPSISITTKYLGDMVLDLPSIWGGETLSSPTCTQEWDANVPNQITGASSTTVASTPSTVSCSWTSSNPDQWDDVAVEIQGNSSGTSGGTTTGGGTAGPTQVTISVNAANSSGSPLTGIYIELQNPSGTDLQTGYSPASFTVTSGQQYVIYANSYGTTQFSHWSNGSTNPALSITPTADMTLTAYYTG